MEMHVKKENNLFFGRAFFHSSTMHSSTQFNLGGYVYRGTQEYCMLQKPGKPESWTKLEHEATFGGWLRIRLINDDITVKKSCTCWPSHHLWVQDK
jgi:hypothetical protein